MKSCGSCHMLNAAGVCDLTLRRPEVLRRCPMARLRQALRTKLKPAEARPRDG